MAARKIESGGIYASRYGHIIWTTRCLIVLTSCLIVYFVDFLQSFVNYSWAFLKSTWIFNSVYFESWFTVTTYVFIIPLYPNLIKSLRYFDKFKLNEKAGKTSATFFGTILGGVIYLAPLMLMDTFMVKKYHGVEPSVWEEKRRSYVQVTRALPEAPPTVYGIIFCIIASLIVYDALFFICHFIMHRNYFLYKHLHAKHHDHEVVHAYVSNKLAIPERIALILSANFALKLFQSHPMTRMVFIPVFLTLIIESHLGYDLPFGTHRVVPFGLAGGSVKHFAHHSEGKSYYQPFFTYIDTFLQWRRIKRH